jgi:hypothetical protein
MPTIFQAFFDDEQGGMLLSGPITPEEVIIFPHNNKNYTIQSISCSEPVEDTKIVDYLFKLKD